MDPQMFNASRDWAQKFKAEGDERRKMAYGELQTTIDNMDVISQSAMIKFPLFNQSMEITQIYSRTFQRVLCCMIPYDVATQRMGKKIFCEPDECIMLWPDRHLDVFYKRTMQLKEYICDVGIKFDIVWDAIWRYNGVHMASVRHQQKNGIERDMLAGAGKTGASMHALLRQLDALG